MSLDDKAINFEQLENQTGIEGCHIPTEDVKEFIKELKDKVVQVEKGIALIDPKAIDKLAGKDLT